MVTIILKTGGAPGSNIDKYGNVSAMGAQNTNTGTHATDLTNALAAITTAASSGGFMVVAYTDDGGAAASRLISTSDFKTVV